MESWPPASKRMIHALCILAPLISILLLGGVSPASAQTTNKTVALPSFDVDVNFPPEGYPGDAITVSITARAKENVRLGELTIHIYAYTGVGEQRTVLIDAIARDVRVRRGDVFYKTYSIVLPPDVPRSPLMATILERARIYKTVYPSYAVWWPPPWWNYSWPWWPYWVVPYSYSYTSEQTTFTSIPLTYVKAATPEYLQLKSEYESLEESYSTLRSENEKLRGDYEELKKGYEELKSMHQAAASENNLLKAELESVKSELSDTRNLMYIFVLTTVVFAATTLLFAVLIPRPAKSLQVSARRMKS
ncbi:MAG: hypothetical protein QW238_00250 [Candidatus Bathyarchaeia archaeon]